MKTCVWSAAFTIIVEGLQLDLSELSDQVREQIAVCIREGGTEGIAQEYACPAQPALSENTA